MEFFVKNLQSYFSDYWIRQFLNYGISVLYFFDKKKDDTEVANYINNLNKVTFNTQDANKQHYEVPTDFFTSHLGVNLKYSSCEWDNVVGINQAEKYTLNKYQSYLKLDQLSDGEYVLEVGNGWGSLCLNNAERYPNLNFESFSNSNTQIEYIKEEIRKRNIKNLKVWKQDIDMFVKNQDESMLKKYARIVSIECIEHCLGYHLLFKKFSEVLRDDGFCFFQILGHNKNSYIMDNNSWMGRNFFTGGIVPSMNLFSYFDEHLSVKEKHIISGLEYSKTLDAWLNNMYLNEKKILDIFNKKYPKQSKHIFQTWRMFYLMSSSSFGYNNGCDYCVGYFIMEKKN